MCRLNLLCLCYSCSLIATGLAWDQHTWWPKVLGLVSLPFTDSGCVHVFGALGILSGQQQASQCWSWDEPKFMLVDHQTKLVRVEMLELFVMWCSDMRVPDASCKSRWIQISIVLLENERRGVVLCLNCLGIQILGAYWIGQTHCFT